MCRAALLYVQLQHVAVRCLFLLCMETQVCYTELHEQAARDSLLTCVLNIEKTIPEIKSIIEFRKLDILL